MICLGKNEKLILSRTARSLLPLKVGRNPISSLNFREPPDPGFNRIINESDLDSEDNVDFEAVIDDESPINCPFIDYEAVESGDGREITDSAEEEATPPRKRGRLT